MNEPDPGLITLASLTALPSEQSAKIGTTPTIIQGMRLGMGETLDDVDSWRMGKTGPHKDGKVRIDTGGKKMWLSKSDAEKVDKYWGWTRGSDWDVDVSASSPSDTTSGLKNTMRCVDMCMGPAWCLGPPKRHNRQRHVLYSAFFSFLSAQTEKGKLRR